MKNGVETKKSGSQKHRRTFMDLVESGVDMTRKAHIVGPNSHDTFEPGFIPGRSYDFHAISPLERIFLAESDFYVETDTISKSDYLRFHGYRSLDKPGEPGKVLLSMQPIGQYDNLRKRLGDFNISLPVYETARDGIHHSRQDIERNKQILLYQNELKHSQKNIRDALVQAEQYQSQAHELIAKIGKQHIEEQISELHPDPTRKQTNAYKVLPKIFCIGGLESVHKVNRKTAMDLLGFAKFQNATCSFVVTNYGTESEAYDTAVFYVKDGQPYSAIAESLRGQIDGEKAMEQFLYLTHEIQNGRIERYCISLDDLRDIPRTLKENMETYLLNYAARSDTDKLPKITEKDLAQ